MEVDHYKQLADLCRIAEPFFRIQRNKIDRILFNLPEMTCPLIHWLLNNKRGVDKHLPDNRDVVEDFILIVAVWYLFWQ